MADRTTVAPTPAAVFDRRMALLLLVALALSAAYMTVNLRGNIAFALELRAIRLVALWQVAVAVAVSTVLFQTLTQNRILTPAIMGMDALYLLGQTGLVFLLGGLGYAGLDPALKFAAESLIMTTMAATLFAPMLKGRTDMTLMLLTGVVLGILFRSLAALLARLIDPNAFAVVQSVSFADFNTLRRELVWPALAVTVAGTVIAWRARHLLDVAALGRARAIGLGLDWTRTVPALLVLVALLVAVSTALVGPVALLGLIVVAGAERLIGSRRHARLLPAACLVGISILVGGQLVLQHGLGGASALGIVVDFAGGLLFLALLAGGRR